MIVPVLPDEVSPGTTEPARSAPGDSLGDPLGDPLGLPPGFVLGTSTSAYQVEGGATADGRGPSTWDAFTAVPGAVADGSSGDPAADHLGRYQEDVALLERLGAPGYRFSFAWPRIFPRDATPNQRGLDFYDRLLDELLGAGLEPMATLHHWDLPQWLEDDGGWLNRATVERFTEYAGLLGEAFGDRVAHWVPIDQPNVLAALGYGSGLHAPGRQLGFDALPVMHHLLLAHGRAVIALRAAGATSVGCANNHAPMWPASDHAADVGATKLVDALWNGMLAEPMLLGRYPVDLQPLLEGIVEEGDLATIRQPLGFYGVSHHAPMRVAATAEDDETAVAPFTLLPLVGQPATEDGWPVVPAALREWLIGFKARFRAAVPPLVVTEVGCPDGTDPDDQGVVDDLARVDYHAAHLRAVAEAVGRGVDVRGYYVASLLDGFAWSEGHRQRFGLVHVDRETQRRTPKRSFTWYAGVVAAQRAANPPQTE